ncbi:unnamed protein product [Orchesella dallaii]|uniref:HRDC domain-containing protein n=1 Tax=Orchesella dallaii TaxID=48710 RepID=A0ABP1S270_9HEXA
MIDTQEAYEITTGKKQVSLSEMVKCLLNVDIDKSAQRADWRLSPLPSELLDYAASDTKLLFQCWIRIKHDAFAIECESFPNSIASQLQLVSSLRANTSAGAWHAYFDSMRSNQDIISRFGTVGQQQLFEALFHWRETVAKDLDFHPTKVLRDKELQFVTRSMPKSIQMFRKLAFFNTNVEVDKYKEALNIIESKRSTVFRLVELANPQSARRVVFFDDSGSDSDREWDFYPNARPTNNVEENHNHDTLHPVLPRVNQNELQEDIVFVPQHELNNTLSMSKLAKKQRRYRANVKARLQLNPFDNPIAKRNKINRIARNCVAKAVRNSVPKHILLKHVNKIN